MCAHAYMCVCVCVRSYSGLTTVRYGGLAPRIFIALSTAMESLTDMLSTLSTVLADIDPRRTPGTWSSFRLTWQSSCPLGESRLSTTSALVPLPDMVGESDDGRPN